MHNKLHVKTAEMHLPFRPKSKKKKSGEQQGRIQDFSSGVGWYLCVEELMGHAPKIFQLI